jgi:pimeloyl-ACP methyl ester carboxylesterase
MSGGTVITRAVRPPPGFRDRWQTIGGLRLHALESTTAQSSGSVLLLPGLVTASRSMIRLARVLARNGLRVLILDPPGFGYSGRPPRAPAVMEQADLIARWLDAVAGRPVSVLGNSFGCQLAAAVAAGYPGRVASLVLISPTVDPRVRRRLGWLRVLPRCPAKAAGGPNGRRRVLLLALAHRLLGQDPPLRVLNVAEYACASIPRAVSAVRHAVADSIEDHLRQIPAPVLVIRGGEDRMSSSGWAARLSRLMPDGRLTRLPGLGHDAFWRDPGAVADAAIPFLEQGKQAW